MTLQKQDRAAGTSPTARHNTTSTAHSVPEHLEGVNAQISVVRAGTLIRTTFTTNRMADFFSEKELSAQTGHEREDWPTVILKELMDNAIDACEDIGTPPEIEVEIGDDGLAVTDNGPGIPEETVERILDFATRTSSREAYVAPTRGAQGNAMKTIIAAPYILSGDERRGRVDIEACGVRHEIEIKFDAIRQEPIIDRQRISLPGIVKTGTRVRVELARSILEEARLDFLQIAIDAAWLNPHLSLRFKFFDEEVLDLAATDINWKKWLPCYPTSIWWYALESFERLIAAYVAHDDEHGRNRTVREFIKEFDGMKGSAKQKAVAEAAGLSRATLASLRDGDHCLDRKKVAALREAMRAQTKPVNPRRLGEIGKDHIAAKFEEIGADMATFRYERMREEIDAVPYVTEVAFAEREERDCDTEVLYSGVNWSPSIGGNPFRRVPGNHLLSSFMDDPVLLFVHVATPGVQFLDRGKSCVAVANGTTVIGLVEKLTARWAKKKRKEKRQDRREAREAEKGEKGMSQKDAAYGVMREAYFKASGGNTFPAAARQVMYVARGDIERLSGKPLDDVYFTQTLLPDYLAEHPDETRSWDVVFDARGHFAEPHTDKRVDLGTLAVRSYLGSRKDEAAPMLDLPEVTAGLFPTRGPNRRFGAVLFVEKEGFLPLFDRAQIAERFDLAVMSTKGISNTSSRSLVENMCADEVPLFVLHDFDKSGFTILSTLKDDTRRYKFQREINIVDLGLRLQDVQEWQLQGEDVDYGSRDPRPYLRAHGATEEEIAYLVSFEGVKNGKRIFCGQRVELNAFTSDAMIKWIVGKLEEHGVKKIVPDNATLESAYRHAVTCNMMAREMARLEDAARRLAADVEIPVDLREAVIERLRAEPTLPWDTAVNIVATIGGAA